MCEVFERFKHPPVNVPNLDAFDAPERQAIFSYPLAYLIFAWKYDNVFATFKEVFDV